MTHVLVVLFFLYSSSQASSDPFARLLASRSTDHQIRRFESAGPSVQDDVTTVIRTVNFKFLLG